MITPRVDAKALPVASGIPTASEADEE